MKFWIKIVVAVAVIAVIGLGVWAFGFREKDEVQAYNKTTELIDFKESLGLKEKLINLRKTNYYGNDPSNILDESFEQVKQINSIRDICLDNETIVEYDSTGTIVKVTYESYFTIDKYVDEILEYLIPYTKSNRVHSSSLKNLKKSVNTYIESLELLDSSLDNVVDVQLGIKNDETGYKILKQQYESLKNRYRQCLENSSQVIIDMINFINKSTYSGDLLMDTSTALYDSFARALNACSNCDKEEESLYSGDLYYVVTKINQVNNGESIYSDKYTEYDFLNAYNNLFLKYQGALDYVYSCVNAEKKQMSANTNLSKIVEKAQPSVVIMLNVLGF